MASVHSVHHRRGFQRVFPLWRDARVESLDGLAEAEDNYPGDDFLRDMSDHRLRNAKVENLAGGSKGATPLWQV